MPLLLCTNAEDGAGLPPNTVLVCFVGRRSTKNSFLCWNKTSSTANKDVKMLFHDQEMLTLLGIRKLNYPHTYNLFIWGNDTVTVY
jgi:hypothetical protein